MALPAYQQEFARLATDMAAGRPSDEGPSPSADPEGGKVELQPGVVLDAPPLGKEFGDVLEGPEASYRPGEQVRVVFASAHPGNELHRDGTYLEVQRRDDSGWTAVADDGDWSTKHHWARRGVAASTATVTWDVPADTTPGVYRVVHHGDAKDVTGRITPFTGASGTFGISAS
ncbi:hypothetical protein FHX42_004222 [Saccharopolyspora lacisalsi]|uniref:Neutral/alkaline non-lysosomal ceramidase C-terminal domain-containing protein n=1 Tax=Halosaccharopolyspora lacisalsi TaxID=1000566 RepID=A0A839E0M9_9PSEU|nr:neutral/alkaline non-lysosomal ceramidase C-terminal domain-containing protein [Halosaccharopolyspora lacisalsi]MBA8826843.1 hypothetical protein [Halosaccharopolyspora lacisalsi]